MFFNRNRQQQQRPQNAADENALMEAYEDRAYGATAPGADDDIMISDDSHGAEIDYDAQSSPYTVNNMLKGIQSDKKLSIGGQLAGAEYLFRDEEKRKGKTGWNEKLVYNTGTLYGLGLASGGAWGLYEGLKAPQGNTFKLRLNSVLNSMTRRGPLVGNSAGILSLFYTTFDHFIGRARGGTDDLLNNVVAGALSGAVFKCTSGLPAAGKAALVFGSLSGVLNGAISLYTGSSRGSIYASSRDSNTSNNSIYA